MKNNISGKILVYLFAAGIFILNIDVQSGKNDFSDIINLADKFYEEKMYGFAIDQYDKYLKINPGSTNESSILYKYAECFYNLKNFSSAINLYKKLIKLYPENTQIDQAWFHLADCQMAQKDFNDAAYSYLHILKNYPASKNAADVLFFSGKAYYFAARFEESREMLQKYLKKRPETEFGPEILLILAEIYLKEADDKGAISFLEDCIAKYPKDTKIVPKAYSLCAHLYDKTGQADKSEDYYNTCFTKYWDVHKYPEKIREYAEFLFKEKKFEKAADIYRLFIDSTENELTEIIQFRIGECLRGCGKYRAALTEFELFRENFPESPKLFLVQYKAALCMISLKKNRRSY
ncbi:MAG: tetratricopeptide repeat protein [bacterium]